MCWVSLVEVNLNAGLFVLPDELAFLSPPCTVVANSLGLYFQDDISGNAACGTVDGSTTIGTLGDVIVRLELDHKIMTGPMSSHFCCTTQNMRSISGLTILTGDILNPRLTNFSVEHWLRLRFLKRDTSALVLLVISFLFAHISTSWMYKKNKTQSRRQRPLLRGHTVVFWQTGTLRRTLADGRGINEFNTNSWFITISLEKLIDFATSYNFLAVEWVGWVLHLFI